MKEKLSEVKAFFKRHWFDIIIFAIFAYAVAFSLEDFIAPVEYIFVAAFALMMAMLYVVNINFRVCKRCRECKKCEEECKCKKKEGEEKEEDSQLNLENDLAIEELTNTINEQHEVISEYEMIFDEHVVRIDCPCGQNTFEGLFPPNMENIVVCEKCNNKYRVEITHNVVLLAEPKNINLVQQFDEAVKENLTN